MVSQALELFSVTFLQTLIHEIIDENIFYSPLSIMAAFSMLLLGTKNNSTNQLMNALKFNNIPINNVHRGMLTLIEKSKIYLSKYDSTELSIANGLFSQQNFPIKSQFKSDLQTYYKSEMKEVNFTSPLAVKEINKWVENKTKDKIKELFPENAFDSLTRLVLANAVYFKGSFKDSFTTKDTIKKSFYKSGAVKTEVNMMQKLNKDHFFIEDSNIGLKMLSIPFQNHKLRFLLLLPTTRFRLDKALSRLKENDFNRLVKSMRLRKVSKLEVPRFKIDTEMDLKHLMGLQGVTDIFDRRRADLTGISDEKLVVDKAVHKTFLGVNEFGVEAAAVTPISIGIVSMPIYADNTPIQFIIDEPFLLSIYNTEAEAIVFLGRINDPLVN